MATTAQVLRLCTRQCRAAMPSRALKRRRWPANRYFSASPAFRDENTEKPPEADVQSSEAEQKPTDPMEARFQAILERLKTSDRPVDDAKVLRELGFQGEEFSEALRSVQDVRDLTSKLAKPTRIKQSDFWNEEEDDPDMVIPEHDSDDAFDEDDITAMAHAKLEEHREMREYARLAIWDLPLLSKFAKPFEPPREDQCLRFRYTTYMGELHPAEKKVVVEFSPEHLKLSAEQQLKLKKLVGARYNPERDIVRISCEMFQHQAQNKRYLGDLVEKLVAQAKDTSDMFEDVPLDTRHHVTKPRAKFPKEWRMTEQRQAQLRGVWQQALQLDETRKAEGKLLDGRTEIQQRLAAAESQELEAELLRVPAGGKQKFTRR